ncbi:HAMP domain-containing histidine kinase [Aquincola sp. S2]|uniref:histidine kinase n=1 Tax=Pseudaquabacterium terrae TaxID=2732868 RepID=A0ABX2EJU5_9BURK|nr:HAMP domain-containing sensor histidine kinase [Aquabacterium terrae]NRF68916.1 HAMP domain-containing histidine kinase [Aquabacterium terrae]
MSTTALCSAIPATPAQRELDHLREALQQAEAANRAMSVLVAKLGHELKTPLNAIVGLAQLIHPPGGREPQPEVVDRWLDQIARLGWHMADVVDTLMELGRCGAGHLRAGCETLDVLEPMTEALRIVESDAARRDITIGFVGDVQAQVKADRRALRQVFVNLLSNAIKYNKEGGRVSLSVRGGERVRITVRDTGPGLTSAQRARLFQAFDRLGAERTGVEGHGLGLLLCRELLLAMDGSIDVDSVDGAGCTFTVTLPGRAA